jgi:hypothetical protein
MNRLIAGLLLIVLAGCGGQTGALQTAAAPPDVVTRTVEKDGKFLAFVGPRRQHAEPFLGVPSTNVYLLRSWVDSRSGETAHQLYVEDSYFGAEREWNAARDGQGQPLRFVPISRNEISCDNNCSYAEEFAAVLPEALLRANPNGLSVTFTSRSGLQKTIAVPGELIAKQLAAVDAARPARPTAARPAGPTS